MNLAPIIPSLSGEQCELGSGLADVPVVLAEEVQCPREEGHELDEEILVEGVAIVVKEHGAQFWQTWFRVQSVSVSDC